MQFKESFITDKGNKLLSEAISNANNNAKSIIWTKSCTSSDAAILSKTRKEIQALTDITPYSSYGFVINAVHSETAWDESASAESLNHHTTSLTCEITNELYNGNAYSFGVWAKLKNSDGSEGAETLVAVARISPNDTPGVIPNKQQSLYKANITFVISIDDHAVNLIQTPDSFYATAQSLQNLENRVVTTHIEGNETAGEDQHIYGNKTFWGNNNYYGNSWFHNNVYLNDDTVTCTITPTRDVSYDLGSNQSKWKNAYINNVNATTLSGKLTGEVVGNVTGNVIGTATTAITATTATTAINLTNKPILNFKEATTSGDATLSVTAGEKTSVDVNITRVKQAYQTFFVKEYGLYSFEYYIPFVSKNDDSGFFTAQLVDNNERLMFNPKTGTLTCLNFNGNADTATTADSLANNPKISFSNASYKKNATSGNITLTSASLSVTAGEKLSNSVNVDFVRYAIQPLVRTTSGNYNYPLVFANYATAGGDINEAYKYIFTDSQNEIYYNASTNTLTCPNITCTNISGLVTKAKADSNGKTLDVTKYVNSIESGKLQSSTVKYLTFSNTESTTQGYYSIPTGYLVLKDSSGSKISERVDIKEAIAGILSGCLSTSTNYGDVITNYNIGCITLVMFKTTAEWSSVYNACVGRYIINPKPVYLFSNGTDNNTALRMSGSYAASGYTVTLSGLWRLLTHIGAVNKNEYAYALAVRVA